VTEPPVRGAQGPSCQPDSKRCLLYHCAFSATRKRKGAARMELNPVITKIDDLKGRAEALRGYL